MLVIHQCAFSYDRTSTFHLPETIDERKTDMSPNPQQDFLEMRERRNLGANFEASLLDTGGLVLTLDSGSAAILKAEQAYNLLEFLDEHRWLLHQKSQEQADEETEVQKDIVKDWITRSHATQDDQAQGEQPS
jgi:hypothetical protein